MRERFTNPFNNSKLKAILFFLLLATLFWALTKFSRQYTATATATIRYLNAPESTQVKDNSPEGIDFNLTTSGFEFLYYKFKRPIVNINLRNFHKKGSKEIVISKYELIGILSSQLKADIAIRNLRNDEITIGLDPLILKQVVIKANTKFTYKDGFRSLDSLKIEPDSVVLSGPASYLNEIDFVTTGLLSKDNIDKTFSQLVSIIGAKNAKVSIDPMKVNISLSVAEFSQKKVIVPIELINVPQGTIVKLIPKEVMVIFTVSVNDFKYVTANDFKLVCDFDKRNRNEDYIFISLEEYPLGIYNTELSAKKIDYLIFK